MLIRAQTGRRDRTVARIVQAAAERAGLDPKAFAGHSLRSGFATTAAKKGNSLDAVMRQTLHKSEQVARDYIRHAKLFDDNAAGPCDVEMPPQGYDFVGSGQLLQAGPEWNSRFNVLNDVSVATFGALGVLADPGVDEGCNFSTSYVPSESLTMFQWSQVPVSIMGLDEVRGPVRADVRSFVRPQ